MNKYNFEFWRWHFNCDNFNQKHASIILSIISQGRLHRFMRFSSYGNITFDNNDEGHRYPFIEELESFNRNKTNCLIFDLTNNEKNDGRFNKLFLYHSNGSQHSFYGYVFYNTENKEITHKYFVDHEYDELCMALTKSFNTLLLSKVFNFYSEKFDAIKNNLSYGLKKDEDEFFRNYNELLEKY